MKPFRTSALLAAFVLVAVLPASASAALTAKRIRIAPHTGFVRVVVDFTGAALAFNDANMAPGNIDTQGRARLDITKAGATTTAAAASGSGANVSIVRVAGGLRVRITSPARRFKFLGYTVLHSPERLVIDLYRRASLAQLATGGCLTILPTTTSTSGRVTVRGTVTTRIFENNFRVRLRRSNGGVVAADDSVAGCFSVPAGDKVVESGESAVPLLTTGGTVTLVLHSASGTGELWVSPDVSREPTTLAADPIRRSTGRNWPSRCSNSSLL